MKIKLTAVMLLTVCVILLTMISLNKISNSFDTSKVTILSDSVETYYSKTMVEDSYLNKERELNKYKYIVYVADCIVAAIILIILKSVFVEMATIKDGEPSKGGGTFE